MDEIARRVVAGLVFVAVAALVLLSVDVEHVVAPHAGEIVPSAAFEPALPAAAPLRARGADVFYGAPRGEALAGPLTGLLQGPLTLASVLDAIDALDGASTTNLRVALVEDATIAGRRLYAGEVVDTGLDVPAGWVLPLGIGVRVRHGRPAASVTCALCHATVERPDGRVLEGVPNDDLALGMLLALAPNSSAAFPAVLPAHEIEDLPRGETTIVARDGSEAVLADGAALEELVDRALVAWPPGRVDATANGRNDPIDIPGLLGNPRARLHLPGFDATGDAASAPAQHGLDPEVYLGMILQRAPSPRYRVQGERPSEVLREADGGAEVTDGRSVEALQAWLAALALPVATADPRAPQALDEATAAQGREVFARAGCGGCHAPDELVGLAWTAPYLRDGGVAVGADPLRDVGVPSTAMRDVPVDARQSLRALFDRRLREAVVASNRIGGLEPLGIAGRGHAFWVDPASGFDDSEQLALIELLLGGRVLPSSLAQGVSERPREAHEARRGWPHRALR